MRLFGRAPQSPLPPGRDAIVPRIKSTKMLEELARMGYGPEMFPVTEPLAADLVVSYAFDLPQAFQMLPREELERLAIRPEELRPLAVANLFSRRPDIEAVDIPSLMAIRTGHNLEACTLLVDPFWNGIAADTPGEVVAAVPNRDVVLYCSSQSPEGMAALKRYAEAVYLTSETHALSQALLVWRAGSWAPFSP